MNKNLDNASEIAADLKAQAAAEAGASSTASVQVEVKIAPPPPYVRTIKQLIYWEYAKLMARAAGPKMGFGFIVNRYQKLERGEIKWADLKDEVTKQIGREPKCEYCDATGVHLTRDHIIPVAVHGLDIPENIVMACKSCNSSKSDLDVFHWYYVVKRETEIPKLVWSKYLKLVYEFHQLNRTLDKSDLNNDGQLNILDLGAIFHKYNR